MTLRRVDVNGSPGMLSFDAHQRLIGVLALEISNCQITAISSINNPERLAHLGQATRWRSPPGESERYRRKIAARLKNAEPSKR